MTGSSDADYATIPANSNIYLNFDTKTISVWFYAGQQMHSQAEIIDKTDNSDYDIDLLTNAASDIVELRFRAFNGATAYKVSGLVPVEQWINAVVVKSGTNISFYTNASLAGMINVNSVTTKSNVLFVGAGGSPYEPGFGFNGLIEDLRFYNRALDTNEIHQLYYWSYPALTIYQPASSAQFQITWNAISGQTYQLQYITDLTSTTWSNIGGSILATNGEITYSDTNNTSMSQRFYRAVLLQ